MQTKVKKKQPAPAPLTQPMVQRQLAGAVDAGAFQHRDPLWHVTESFQQTFDRIGRRRAAQLTLESEGGAGLSAVLGGFSAETARQQQEAARPGADRSAQRSAAPTRERKAQYHPELPQGPIQTFSETAFQRGNLAASVLQGTGRMMLATCLKRSLGQGEPNQQRQTLFGAGSQARTVPGSSPDQMVFYRGFAESAVGLVVDVLADARAVVDSLTEMAQGAGSLKEDEGAATLRRVYPFLDDSREQQLLAGYQEQLAAATDEREKPVLQNAIAHTRALIARKGQMKNEFISKLRWISNQAEEALEELEGEETLEYLTAALRAPHAPEDELPPGPPPDEPPDRPADQPALAAEEEIADAAEQQAGDDPPAAAGDDPQDTAGPQPAT